VGWLDRFEQSRFYRRLYRHRDGSGRPWTQESRDWLLARRHRVAILAIVTFAVGFAAGAYLCPGALPGVTILGLWALLTIGLAHWLL
jgi:hypothetical protein